MSIRTNAGELGGAIFCKAELGGSPCEYPTRANRPIKHFIPDFFMIWIA